jgi:tetratricopeptide (TPR) repeat protein
MIDVAAKLRGRGWMTGFLDRPDELDDPTRRQRWQALEQLLDHRDDAGLLLVLDYAEGRQSELVDLGRRIAKRPGSAARPIRLILLARSAGEWWERLVTEQPELDGLVASAVDASAVVPLSVIPQPAQRTALFDAAATAFAERGWPRPSPGPPPELRARIAAGEDFERPLAVQMAALLWLASAEPAAGSASIDKLLDRILGLERAHWVKLLGALSEDQLRDLGRGIGQVTLVQGVESIATAERLLMGDSFYGDTPRARFAIDPVLRALRRLYGRAGGIGSIEPDLLGEHHVADERVGDTDLLAGCLAWIADQPEERRARHRRDLLTVLQRATHRVHGAETARRAEAMLDHIIARHAVTFAAELVGVMIETPGNLAQLLDGWIAELDEDALAEIATHLPAQSLSLMDLSLRVAERRVGLARAQLIAIAADSAAPTELHRAALGNVANCFGSLGVRLSKLGRREEALAASQEAVDLYRQLAAARPDAFLPELARSLNNTGVMLSDLGRREEALAAAQEAVDLYRQLAAARPDAFLPDLASGLTNLGRALSHLGRREEALAASQEGVGLYRQLASMWPAAFLPALATSLGALSQALAGLDRAAEAAKAAGEGLTIIAPLVERHPAAFGRLARALRRHVIAHSEAAGTSPDMAILERVSRALREGEA